MTGRDSHLNLILVSTDRTLKQKLERDLGKSTIPATVDLATNLASLQRATAKRTFDGLILETNGGTGPPLGKIQQLVDSSRTFILAGSRDTLLQTARAFLSPDGARTHNGPWAFLDGSFETYLEAKLGDFVRGMKNGSAKDLHRMLMKTVERPLIGHALQATNGNQIKTAHLLGMNRNTLRKKITELRIPVQRRKARRA